MTKDKANEFLKIVKGRKIRVAYWPEGGYIIPTGEWEDTSDKNPYYWCFWYIDEDGEKCCCYIHEGFEEGYDSYKWELLEAFEDYLEMYHNE